MNLRVTKLTWTTSIVASIALCVSTGAANAQQADSKAVFDQVSKRLDVGGQLFGFVNVQGDFESLATKAQELYLQVIEMAGGQIPLPPDLAVEAILKELGLGNVSALGMSSIARGEGFRNKVFLAVNGERQGLLKMTGGAPKPFKLGQFAPSDASVAFEQSIRLDVLRDVVEKIAERLEPAIGGNPVADGLKMPVPTTKLTIDELLTNLSGDVLSYFTLSKTAKLEIPDAPPGLEIPAIDFVIAHESGRWLFDLAKEFFTSNMPDMVEVIENDGGKSLVITLPGDANLGFYKPVLRVGAKGERLLIASRSLALDRMATAKSRLADNAAFKAVTSEFPKEGNGLTFVSKDFYKTFMDVYGQILAMSGGPNELVNLQKKIMEITYGKPQDVAAFAVNQRDGVYIESIQPQSYKQTVAVLAIVPAAIGAGVMMPMIIQTRMRAERQMQRQVQDVQADPF